MKRKKILLWMFILLLFISYPTGGNQDTEKMLILYTDSQERDYLLGVLDTENITVTSRLITDELVETFSGYDIVMFLASYEFSLHSDTDDNLYNYAQDESKLLFMFSPYLDSLESDTQNRLGIKSVKELYEETNVFWDIQSQKQLGGYATDEHFDYTGPLVELELHASTEVLAQAVSSNSSEDIVYPLPTLINSSTGAQTYTSPISLVDKEPEAMLQLSQSSDFIDELLALVISTEVYARTFAGDARNAIDEPSNEDNPADNAILPLEFLESNPITLLLVLLVALSLLFYQRIWDLIRWLSEKTMGMVFVVGAYFTIHNRNISDNEVLYNETRSDIIDQLNYLREFGAHLREIKTMVGLGTGNLLWHLQILEDYELVDKFNVGRHTVFVSRDYTPQFSRKFKEIELQLSSDHSKTILLYLHELIVNQVAEIDLNTLVENTGVHRKTVTRILRKLEKYGIVELIMEKMTIVEIVDASTIRRLQESIELRTGEDSRAAIRIDYLEN